MFMYQSLSACLLSINKLWGYSKSQLDSLFGFCRGEVSVICTVTAFPNHGKYPQVTDVCQLYNHGDTALENPVGPGDSVCCPRPWNDSIEF